MLNSKSPSVRGVIVFILCATFAVVTLAVPKLATAENVETDEISKKEKVTNFGIVVAGQIAGYIITQGDVIREHGSFENWTQYPFSPHFDNDNIEFNLFKHTWVGNYYYLFYRSRGYSERSAFLWTVASSTLFEFAIETVTERPSFQDLYQTPVFGTIVGMGAERASRYFHSIGTIPATTLGYILNPMTLIPGAKVKASLVPTIKSSGETGLALALIYDL